MVFPSVDCHPAVSNLPCMSRLCFPLLLWDLTKTGETLVRKRVYLETIYTEVRRLNLDA